MASAKRSADKPEDADLGAAVDEVEDKSKVVTTSGAGRPNDNVLQKYKVPNSTFAERARAAAKRVGTALNKSITPDETEGK